MELGNGVLLTEGRARIIMMPPSDLLKELQEGTISAVDALRAFQAKVGKTDSIYRHLSFMIFKIHGCIFLMSTK